MHGDATRDAIHAQVCDAGFDARRNSFVQYYGASDLDASLLLIPLVGFLPPEDARVRATVDAIQRELMAGGLVLRYATATGVDNLPPGEGAFLPCTFWLADSLALTGRRRSRGAVRTAARVAQRRRPAVGRIRPAYRPDAGQLSAGADPHGAGQHRPAAVAAAAPDKALVQARRAPCGGRADVMTPGSAASAHESPGDRNRRLPCEMPCERRAERAQVRVAAVAHARPDGRGGSEAARGSALRPPRQRRARKAKRP
jgi:hypothetical protein